jgi:succinoglycan biosynthesis transport protein ExoP
MTEVDTERIRASDPTLRDLVAPFFRRKRMIVLTFCGVLLGTVFVAFFASSLHQASMEILVNHERLDPLLTPESTQSAGSPAPVTDAQVNSEIELLKSPDLLQQVVIANNLQDLERKSLVSRMVHGTQNDAWYVARAIQHLGSKLDIKLVTKTSMIQVSYTAQSPQRAYKVLDTLANRYLEKHLAVHRPQGSYVFFTSQAEKYQQALQESEARLADFSKKSGDAAPDLEKAAMAQEVINSVAALHEAQQKIAADKQRIQDQETRLKATPDRTATQQVSDSAQSLLQKLQGDLLDAEIKKSQLTLKYDPSYPLVQQADQDIAQIKAAIVAAGKLQYVNQTTDRDPTYELIREDIVKTRADLAAHQASATAIEDSIRGLQKQMVDLDQRALKQADLAREVKTNEANYLLYVAKREQERTSDALDEKRIGNVAIAVPPVLPILPSVSPVLVVLIGVVLAVFLSAGTAFVAEYLNPSLRTPAEVLEVLRIPVLASVPKQTA